MRQFPPKFIPTETSNFHLYKFERDTAYLREAIYEHFIANWEQKSKDPTGKELINHFEEPFNLTEFSQKRFPNEFDRMIKIVSKELETLGWKTSVVRSNSELYVYTDNMKPKLPSW